MIIVMIKRTGPYFCKVCRSVPGTIVRKRLVAILVPHAKLVSPQACNAVIPRILEKVLIAEFFACFASTTRSFRFFAVQTEVSANSIMNVNASRSVSLSSTVPGVRRKPSIRDRINTAE
jgi:hypothetical protein